MSDNVMRPLFFLHNPKAGGSSVSHLFRAEYAAESIAPVIENSPQQYRNVAGHYSQFKGYRFYSGHYGYNVFKAVGDGHDLITNFRNPVSRIFSMYWYWRNSVSEEFFRSLPEEDAAFVNEARTRSFSEFIRSDNPNLRLYIDNAHYRQILDTWYINDAAGVFGFVKVLRRIARMKWFFISELPALSHLTLRQAFPRLHLAKVPLVNETRDKQSEDYLSDEDIIFLTKRNRRDFAIYIFAVALMVWRICQDSVSERFK